MNIQLIEGEFKAKDAMDLITQMIHINIKFHENIISKSDNNDDIKAREIKISSLQKNLFDLKNTKGASSKGVKVNAILNIE